MIMRSLPLLSLTILLGVAPLTEHVEAAESRELRFPPLKDGRLVLSVDTHTHSVFSDGHVWPTVRVWDCLLYTSPSPRDRQKPRMPSSA